MNLWTPLEARSTLFKTSAFRITISLFGGTALIYAALKLTSSEVPSTPILSRKYFEYLFDTLGEPVLIAGLALPLLGLIASHLRSIQTKDQIETQEEQNIFSNYSKHREFFNELFKDEGLFGNKSDSWAEELGLTGKAHELHALLYPNAQTGSLYPSAEKIPQFENVISSTEALLASSLKVTWKNKGAPYELAKKVGQHLQLLERSFKLQGRLFQERHELSSIATMVNCLAVTHKDLVAATTFITFNECSQQFEKMHDLVYKALEHLRAVTREQQLLDQLTELAETRERQSQPMSGYLKSGLSDFLSNDTETKLAFIERKISSYSNSIETIQQVRELAESAVTNNGDRISQHHLSDPTSNGHTSLS